MDTRFLSRSRRLAAASIEGQATHLSVALSAQGFSAESLLVPPEGTALAGELQFGGKTFPYRGEVTWSQRADSRLPLRGRMNVRFTSIPEGFFEALRREMGWTERVGPSL